MSDEELRAVVGARLVELEDEWEKTEPSDSSIFEFELWLVAKLMEAEKQVAELNRVLDNLGVKVNKGASF